MRKGTNDLIAGKLDFKAGEAPAPEWTTIKVLKGTNFDELVREYREAHEHEQTYKQIKDDLKGAIQAYLIAAKVGKLRVGELQAVLVHGKQGSKLDGHLLSTRLVEMEVDADIVAEAVEYATVPGAEYDYIQVVKDKDKEKEAEGA